MYEYFFKNYFLYDIKSFLGGIHKWLQMFLGTDNEHLK